jgi:hypothetical protein
MFSGETGPELMQAGLLFGVGFRDRAQADLVVGSTISVLCNVGSKVSTLIS